MAFIWMTQSAGKRKARLIKIDSSKRAPEHSTNFSLNLCVTGYPRKLLWDVDKSTQELPFAGTPMWWAFSQHQSEKPLWPCWGDTAPQVISCRQRLSVLGWALQTRFWTAAGRTPGGWAHTCRGHLCMSSACHGHTFTVPSGCRLQLLCTGSQ